MWKILRVFTNVMKRFMAVVIHPLKTGMSVQQETVLSVVSIVWLSVVPVGVVYGTAIGLPYPAAFF